MRNADNILIVVALLLMFTAVAGFAMEDRLLFFIPCGMVCLIMLWALISEEGKKK